MILNDTTTLKRFNNFLRIFEAYFSVSVPIFMNEDVRVNVATSRVFVSYIESRFDFEKWRTSRKYGVY